MQLCKERFSVDGNGLIIDQALKMESKKVRIYIVSSETERKSTVCIGYSL